jgi:hypothetical protein
VVDQLDALEVYEWLDSWADGDLFELATRMGHAPRNQGDQMIDEWPRGSIALPELKPGSLRPFVQSKADFNDLAAALRVLLFTDEVVLSGSYLCPFPNMNWVDVLNYNRKADEARRAHARVALPALIRRAAVVRPLVESGALLFYEPAELSQGSIWVELPDSLRQRIEQIPLEYVRDERLEYTAEGFAISHSHLGYIRSFGESLSAIGQDRATPLALTPLDERILRSIFVDQTRDSRWRDLSILGTMNVPDFSGDTDALIGLRRSSDALAEFRRALGTALRSIAVMPDTEASSMATAAIVHDATKSELEHVRKDLSRTSIGSVLKNATRRMTFTGVGAAAGAAALAGMGLPVAGAVAGASTSVALNLAESVRELVNDKRSKRESEKIWKIVTSFVAASEPNG